MHKPFFILRGVERVHCLFLFPLVLGKIVVTRKIVSFLCSLDTLLQKNVIVSFFGNQISKWRSFEKKDYFWSTFHIFSHQGKLVKIPSARISLTYIHVFCSSYWLFYLTNFEKIRIYQLWILFGVIPGFDSYSRHFGTINKKQNGEQNLSWNVFYWYVFKLMPNL